MNANVLILYYLNILNILIYINYFKYLKAKFLKLIPVFKLVNKFNSYPATVTLPKSACNFKSPFLLVPNQK